MLMMWNENKSIRALKTETKMLRWGNNCCREDCTHFLFYSFPLCVIFFAASLLSVSDVLVFQVAFLMLFVNLLNKKKKKSWFFWMLGGIAWSQTNCPGSLWNDLACHRGKVVKIEKVFTFDSSNYCRKRHLLVYGLWKLSPSKLK